MEWDTLAALCGSTSSHSNAFQPFKAALTDTTYDLEKAFECNCSATSKPKRTTYTLLFRNPKLGGFATHAKN